MIHLTRNPHIYIIFFNAIHVYPICDSSFYNPCIYVLHTLKKCLLYGNSLHMCELLCFSLQGQIHHLAEFPFDDITNPPSTSAYSLMLYPLCLHSLYNMCDVTMTSLLYIQSLGVNIESPTQAHKYHNQTHESPTKIQRGFHQIKSVIWCPQLFPHAQHLGSCENTCLKL
jgi:hypothetical protein